MTTIDELIKRYLNKNYKVFNKRFFNSLNEEWGFKIVETIGIIFSISRSTAEKHLLEWAISFDLTKKEFEAAIKPQKLKVNWSPSMIQDLRIIYGVESAEEQITRQIAEELSREIDNQLIKTLVEEVHSTQDLEDLAKCVGYESILLEGPNTFTPKCGFYSITSTEMMKHRENSKIWKAKM